MTAASDTIVLSGCTSDKLLPFSSGARSFQNAAKSIITDDFPVLSKSEPISFNLKTGCKPRLLSPNSRHVTNFSERVDRFTGSSKKKTKRNKVTEDSLSVPKCETTQSSDHARKSTNIDRLQCTADITLHSRTEDEGFVDSSTGINMDHTSISSTAAKSSQLKAIPIPSVQTGQPRPTSDSDVSTAIVFGSPDLPRLWNVKTKSEDRPSNTEERVSSSSSPDPFDDLTEDDMEGTALLHLISNSLDRFNAIVHPDELSTSTSALGASADGVNFGSAGSDNVTDFGSSGFGSLVEQSSTDQHGICQLATNSSESETSVPWLSVQYSTSCPPSCKPVCSGDTSLLGSATTDLNQVINTDSYLEELNVVSHQDKSAGFFNLSPSFCALASTLLDADHANTQVKDRTSGKTRNLYTKALTPPPGFTANWTDLLFNQHNNDGDNHSSCRRRESVLVALQESRMAGANADQPSKLFLSNGSSRGWTRSENGQDYETFCLESHKTEAAFQRARSGALGLGRSRLLSSCLPSEYEGSHEAHHDLDACFGQSEGYAGCDLKLSSLQKEFSQSLRFLSPASSSRLNGFGPLSFAATEAASNSLLMPHDGVQSNLAFSTAAATATTVNLTPLNQIPPSASVPTVAFGRQMLPKLSAMKLQDPSRTARCNDHPATTRLPFGRQNGMRSQQQQLNHSLQNPRLGRPYNSPAVRPSNGVSSVVLGKAGGPLTEAVEHVLSNNGKPVVAKWRRACSFYLRGHCKKEDCEFAHDLTKVTCKFWEMGECFKGATCPFLHGYPPELNSTD